MTLSAILRAVADANRAILRAPWQTRFAQPSGPGCCAKPHPWGRPSDAPVQPLSSIGHIGLLILTLLKPLSSIGRYVSGAEHVSRGPGTAVSAHSGAKCFALSAPEVALVYLWYRL